MDFRPELVPDGKARLQAAARRLRVIGEQAFNSGLNTSVECRCSEGRAFNNWRATDRGVASSGFNRIARTIIGSWVCLFLAGSCLAVPNQLGDLNGDGNVDIRDLVLLINHIKGTVPLAAVVVPYADINQDGQIDEVDAALLANLILGLSSPTALPLAHLVKSSPANGESDVSVTRPTVFKLTMPISASSVVTTNNVYAAFGGRHILSWVEISADRQTVSLFYQEPMPGAAQMRVVFDGTGLTDFLGRPLDLDGDGLPGGQAVVDFDTLNNNSLVGTSVAGRVFASELATTPGSTNDVNQPLAGVTITVDGQEQSLRAVTDQFGNFRLDPAPSGSFFVHIDGRTATNAIPGGGYPNGAYYPYVGKEWAGTPGTEVNIGNIYLPLIAAGTLQGVSATQPTSITFPGSVLQQHPELAGVSITVSPNSLFSDDGTRGGRVGLAPVPPDRLPSPLPPGLQFSLVITVQSDGPQNFDQPIPACFPNLPDPTTGQVLPPGAKSALWSFNHRDGRWEIQGSMTVSADGHLVCTDPGVGISFPGWHGVQPGATGFGGQLGAGGGPTTQQGPKPPCQPANATDPVYLFSGEFQETATDMMIKGRGTDFSWTRKYLSKLGPNTVQGNRWDCPNNTFLESQGTNLLLHDGNSRVDTYVPQADGTYASPGFFRQLTKNADGTYTLTFADKGQWRFNAINATPAAGKRSAIVDRNGNTMAYQYDAQGRLSVITDTLGRNIAVAYNPQGYLASLTDFAGRAVSYTYYDGIQPGGNAGDLKSVTTPAVLGTPNGNDFPNGKTTTYTYSTGFADDRLNHNLLTITDGRRNDTNDVTFGQGPYLANIYSSTTDPSDPNFDRVVRQIWGGNSLDMVYVPMLPSNPNGNSVMKTIVRDRNGNVKEYFYDAENRMVRSREYTGRANPAQPTTELGNRPAGKLRVSDPDYFETVYEWTSDSLQRRIIHPNGNITEYTYEGDLNPSATARTRGNLRILRHLPGSHLPAGDEAVIQESYEYDTDFSSCCGFNFITSETDGRGNMTIHEYDSQGNRIRTRYAVAGAVEDWEYNQFGQVTAHLWPPDASGNRRRDEEQYYTAGPQLGYAAAEIVDTTGLRLTNSFAHDIVGNVVRVTDPRGHDTQWIFNALDQVVRELSPEIATGSGIRYRRDYSYDANNNLVRFDVLNMDENGAIAAKTNFTTRYEYEALNKPVRIIQDVDNLRSVITEFAYDGNRNRVLVRQPEAVNGHQPANVIQIQPDERDLTFQLIRAPGDPAQSTSEFDYDGNGNRIRSLDGIEAGAHVTTYDYDGYDRLVASTDPMGNRVLRQLDAAHNLIHSWAEGELIDTPGSTNNVRLAEITRVFDELNRLVQVSASHFDPLSQQPIGSGTSTTLRQYAPNSMPTRVVNDNGHEIILAYDSAYRFVGLTDAKGNSLVRTFDASGNVVATTATEKSDLGGPDALFTTAYVFDNLNRVTRVTDNAGDVNETAYDSRNNRVLTLDAARASAASPGNRTRMSYDGLGRLTQVTRELTSDGTGSGSPAGQIVLVRGWDDDSRLISRSDGNGNLTQFVYDPLDRLTGTVLASGAAKSLQYDAHSDTVLTVDANGSVIRQTFDSLDRVVRKDITPGLGVAGDTTFEVWAYDGVSRPVRAANDGTQVSLGYDSLGNLTQDALGNRVAQRAYDGLGNAVSTLYPGGRKLSVAYDALEQVKTLVDTTGASPFTIASYSYGGPGRVVRRTDGNNSQLDLAYDAINRLARSTHSVIGGAAFEDRDYSWDPNSNQTLNRDRLTGGFTQAFVYDSIYRLVGATDSGSVTGQRSYQLDAAGNRVSVSGAGNVGPYSVGPPAGPNAVLNQYSSTPFDQRAYDTNGNLAQVSAGGQTHLLEFDYMNRLVRYSGLGITNRYTYDALSRRVQRTPGNGAGAVRYFHLGAQVLEEEDVAGNTQATYVYGPAINDVVSMQRNATNYWLHADSQWSVRRLTDASGKVAESYTYDEFGNLSAFDSAGRPIASSAVGNPYLFTGHEYDPETGFYYARQRYYEPRSGRFITRDPAGAFGDPINLGNAFSYVGNNPATWVDPMGLSGEAVQGKDLVGPEFNSASGGAGVVARVYLKQAADATRSALTMNRNLGKEMLDDFEDFSQGNFEDIVGEELSGGIQDIEFVRMAPKEVEEAAAYTNVRWSMGAQKVWKESQLTKIAAAEEKAAKFAQRAGRLKTAGKVLGAVGVAVQTGMAVYDDIKNCADAVTTINDAVGTAGSSAALLAAPPLAAVDALTGGTISGGIHNAAITPITVAKLRYGRVSNRDADAIKSTYTRFAVARWAWDAGEYYSDNSVVQGIADFLVGN